MVIDKQYLNQQIANLNDDEIRGLFMLGINALDNPAQKPMVTGAMQKIKNRIKDKNYPDRNNIIDIAINISKHIYESDPENHIYLEKLCEFLVFKKGNEDEIIERIRSYFDVYSKERLDQNSIDFITVTMASAYQWR